MKEKVGKDNIDILYKKYFTPESFDKPITESKQTLKYELQIQLYKYGIKVFNKKFTIDDFDVKEEICSETVNDAIEKCFSCWRKNLSEIKSCKAYFSEVVSNLGRDNIKKINSYKERNVSLYTPISNDDENATLLDFQEDKRNVTEEFIYYQEAKERFLFIDKCYRLKKRSDFLKAMVTQHLYIDLHKYFDFKKDEKDRKDRIERYMFIDKPVYYWPKEPSAKEIAVFLGKDEGQMCRAKKEFLTLVSEMYKANGEKD